MNADYVSDFLRQLSALFLGSESAVDVTSAPSKDVMYTFVNTYPDKARIFVSSDGSLGITSTSPRFIVFKSEDGQKLNVITVEGGESESKDLIFRYLSRCTDVCFRPFVETDSTLSGTLDAFHKAVSERYEKSGIPKVFVLDFVHKTVKQVARKGDREANPLTVEKLICTDGSKLADNQSFMKVIENSVRDVISALRKLKTASEAGSSMNSVEDLRKFWSILVDELTRVQNELRSPEIRLLMEVLKFTRRLPQRKNLEEWIKNISDVFKKAKQYNTFLEQFPIEGVLSSTNMSSLGSAMSVAQKKLEEPVAGLPLEELISLARILLGTLSQDIERKLQSILVEDELLEDDGEAIMNETKALFTKFRVNFRSFVDFYERKIERSSSIKVNKEYLQEVCIHYRLEYRLDQLAQFRRDHDYFRDVVEKAVDLSDRDGVGIGSSVLRGMTKAYDAFVRTVSGALLDVSKDGNDVFSRAVKEYSSRIQRVEGGIVQLIKEKRKASVSVQQAYRTYALFRPLSGSPKLHVSVSDLLENVLQAIQRQFGIIQDKFQARYEASDVATMNFVRNLPEVAGAVVWARRIQNEVEESIAILERCFGRQWVDLLKIRGNGDHWVLNESLSEIMGIPYQLLRRKMLADPFCAHIPVDVFATALALAYLETMCESSSKSWSDDTTEPRRWLKDQQGYNDRDIVTRINDGILHRLRSECKLDAGLDLRTSGWNMKLQIQRSIKERIDTWLEDTEARIRTWDIVNAVGEGLVVSGKIFCRQEVSDEVFLHVNFPVEAFQLLREIETFSWLGVKRMADRVRPVARALQTCSDAALSLIQTMRAFRKGYEKINEDVYPLVANDLDSVARQIVKEMNLEWSADPKLESFAKSLADTVKRFGEKVDECTVKQRLISENITKLTTVSLRREDIRGIIVAIATTARKHILKYEYFSNVDYWLHSVDTKIEEVLLGRVEDAIRTWVEYMSKVRKLDELEEYENEIEENRSKDEKLPLALKTFMMRMQIVNNVISVNPSVQVARSHWYHVFHTYLGNVLGQRRARVIAMESAVPMKKRDITPTYQSVIYGVDSKLLHDAYECIEKPLRDVTEYVQSWLHFQALWNMDVDDFAVKLGDDLKRWLEMLVMMKEYRASLETREPEKSFGCNIVQFSKALDRIRGKFEEWNGKIFGLFKDKLAKQIKLIHDTLLAARNDLENMKIDATRDDTADTFERVNQYRENSNAWKEQIEGLAEGERFVRSMEKLPGNWLCCESLSGAWSSFEQILQRKESTLSEMREEVELKIHSDSEDINNRIDVLAEEIEMAHLAKWTTDPKERVKMLTEIAYRVNGLSKLCEKCVKGADALEIAVDVNSEKIDKIKGAIDEYTTVWRELVSIWSDVEGIRSERFKRVEPRVIRDNLEKIMKTIDELPTWIQQYEGVGHVRNIVAGYRKCHGILTLLHGDSMEDRHWTMLARQLHQKLNKAAEIKLGSIYDLDVISNEQIFRRVIEIAQGEYALHNLMKGVQEYWDVMSLELVQYKNKVPLVRGWGPIFEKILEDQNSLSGMRNSPYFARFKDICDNWETKLDEMRVILELWMDVQKRWVHLDGIFAGSVDIRNQLPGETIKFRTASDEFVKMMRERVFPRPGIMEVLKFRGLKRQLDRLLDFLSNIQKSLGDYLEKQRSAFARFYFVGDEDLLEILGNSKNPMVVQKHLRKMFGGVQDFTFETDNVINGVNSKEGEVVKFEEGVDVSAFPKVHEWLSLVDSRLKITLARMVDRAVPELGNIWTPLLGRTSANDNTSDWKGLFEWTAKYVGQVVNLAFQVCFCQELEKLLRAQDDVSSLLNLLHATIESLANMSLTEKVPQLRRKYIRLITMLVHKRDVCRRFVGRTNTTANDFDWLYYLRYYWVSDAKDVTERLRVRIGNTEFVYGFEYFGLEEELVQTPLTDRAYFTLTQALHSRLGGNPFGPAGTGKTETVKALGCQLGRFVLVFNCDEKFDFRAVGRIFLGLCHCGAWGCFDEFNRLEERILSALSQQIQTIQTSLRSAAKEVEIIERRVPLSLNTGIFITMNPGYAGRRNLPDNLKQLFRPIAMAKPDSELIAEVILFSQGFREAEILSRKIVPLFDLCGGQLSRQAHYDFGLRALKSVLVTAGNIRRQIMSDVSEQQVMVRSVLETMEPKLVSEDIQLLRSLVTDFFPSVSYFREPNVELEAAIKRVCESRNLVLTDSWMRKLLQLCQITTVHHGIMLVGGSGTGKSTCWSLVLDALSQVDGVTSTSHQLDPKALTKEELYGFLDSTTREWKDGVFTNLLRRISEEYSSNDAASRHWIIFDGDVDPEWVENLNSVLDDNKLLTLPSGERIALTPNVRLLFEVESLKQATPATVSRCGIVWFSEDVVTVDMMCEHFVGDLKSGSINLEDLSDLPLSHASLSVLQKTAAEIYSVFLSEQSVLGKAMNASAMCTHVMRFSGIRAVSSVFSALKSSLLKVARYQEESGLTLTKEVLDSFLQKSMLLAMIWSLGGSMDVEQRQKFAKRISGMMSIPPPSCPVLDAQVRVSNGEWISLASNIVQEEIDTSRLSDPDVVIRNVETERHEKIISGWLEANCPVILCGPPGSGKTMTLVHVLQGMSDTDVVFLSFSSETKPDLIWKTLERYCEFERKPEYVLCSPRLQGRKIVVLCDEINLPSPDTYGTQTVISQLRQIIELGGFYRSEDNSWIKLDRILFTGTCNPPTDPGRHPLSDRFLRHCQVLLVDMPSTDALSHIYGTFCRALLRPTEISGFGNPVADAMVDVFAEYKQHFSAEVHPHYMCSPRELSRWVRGLYEVVSVQTRITINEFIRLLAHEGLRIFQDRLVEPSERDWTNEMLDRVFAKSFPSLDTRSLLLRPILFSDWLTKNYASVDKDALREHIVARLRSFADEELDVQLVVFDEVLEHVVRIDRALRQPLGHMLLVGVSGAGKTVLTRFVAWMSKLAVFQIKADRNYDLKKFKEDLRTVMQKAGLKDERICFLFDESNILQSSFLEYMNALLASGDVPGLFEGQEYARLIEECRESMKRMNVMVDTEDEVYRWFVSQVRRNLHVVMTMNPANSEYSHRTQTSPALFNRCVVDWFGNWSLNGYQQVASELTSRISLDVKLDSVESVGSNLTSSTMDSGESLSANTQHKRVAESIVLCHEVVRNVSEKLVKRQGVSYYLTPRHFLDFIQHFRELYTEKVDKVVDEQLHLNRGLERLAEAENDVSKLESDLKAYEEQLREKDSLAGEKLKQIVSDQSEAEQHKKAAAELSAELEKQAKEVAMKKEIAFAELQQVEPLVEEARDAVKHIKKKQLDELRALPQPPVAVKYALQGVCYMLGRDAYAKDWDGIRRVIRDSDFISSIVEFDSKQLSTDRRKLMNERFLSNPNFTFEKANRSSKACGPLVKWARSQVRYSDVLERAAPLRDQLSELEVQLEELVKNKSEQVSERERLEEQISRFKDEYAHLIAEVESIKGEMKDVKKKTTRASALVTSLLGERARWKAERTSFESEMTSLLGDVMLSAAFLTYSGFFDEYYRQSVLIPRWMKVLEKLGLEFRDMLSFAEFLTTPDERLKWHAYGLPSDDLSVENAIMLQRFNRYPLIVDPSGQALRFVFKLHSRKSSSSTVSEIKQVSFLDPNFVGALQNAIRCGTTLVVEDMESADPVLNSVLNREVYHTGGRVLLRVGDREVDVSPTFQLFLVTRDPSAQFSADLSSRVTFVNFTLSPGSLVSQCLHHVLTAERPDIEERRTETLKLQGEYKARLRSLEQELLVALNEGQGNILENTNILEKLEVLKREALDVEEKVRQVDVVMKEVEIATAFYLPFATACSRIYFTCERLPEINLLYQFSLDFFMGILLRILSGENEAMTGITDPSLRVEALRKCLFQDVYREMRHSIFLDDSVPFGLRLAQIALTGTQNEISDAHVDLLVKSSVVTHSLPTDNEYDEFADNVPLSQEQFHLLRSFCSSSSFSRLCKHMKSNVGLWKSILEADAPEDAIPSELFEEDDDEVRVSFNKLLLLRIMRPDRIIFAAWDFTSAVIGETVRLHGEPNLDATVRSCASRSPLLLCAKMGLDVSKRVEALAANSGRGLHSIAMGSPEGYELADRIIPSAISSGQWVLLKNVHLAPRWLAQLEKRLHTYDVGNKFHADFRMFMTLEVHSSGERLVVPTSLVMRSHVIVFESPPGVQANIQRAFAVTNSRHGKGEVAVNEHPVERARLHLMLALLHSFVLERVRYCPLGWSQKYEFNESDLSFASNSIDEWVSLTSFGKENVKPTELPLDAIKGVLSECVYGGRMYNKFDTRVLQSLLNRFMSPDVYNTRTVLAASGEDGQSVTAPQGTRIDNFVEWMRKLPLMDSPSWVGLPHTAQAFQRELAGREVLSKFLVLQNRYEDESAYELDAGMKDGDKGDGVLWNAERLGVVVNELLRELMGVLKLDVMKNKRSGSSSDKPICRFGEREIELSMKTVHTVIEDLRQFVRVTRGEERLSNHVRSLFDALSKEFIPEGWSTYEYYPGMSSGQWVTDLVERIGHLNNIHVQLCNEDFDVNCRIWLGGLLFPEAFLTATRQFVSKMNSWSMEDVELKVEVGGEMDKKGDFLVEKIYLQATEWSEDDGKLIPSPSLHAVLPVTRFRWCKRTSGESKSEGVVLPLYLDASRRTLLTEIAFPTRDGIDFSIFYERGATALAWHSEHE